MIMKLFHAATAPSTFLATIYVQYYISTVYLLMTPGVNIATFDYSVHVLYAVYSSVPH